MWRAYSMVLRKYITASECNYIDVSKLQIKCPYCYEPVMLRKGEYVSSYFAHYSNTKKYSITGLNKDDCPNRVESNGYGGYSIENFFSYQGQELLVQFAHFSQFFDEFIHYKKSDRKIDEHFFSWLKDRLRQRADKNDAYAMELSLPQMKDFLDITLTHYLQKSLAGMPLKFLEYDSVAGKIISSYLLIMKGLSDCYKNHSFDFSKEGIAFKEYYTLYESVSFKSMPRIVIRKGSGYSPRKFILSKQDKKGSGIKGAKTKKFKKQPFFKFCAFIRSLDSVQFQKYLKELYDELNVRKSFDDFIGGYEDLFKKHKVIRSDWRINRLYRFYCRNYDKSTAFRKNVGKKRDETGNFLPLKKSICPRCQNRDRLTNICSITKKPVKIMPHCLFYKPM